MQVTKENIDKCIFEINSMPHDSVVGLDTETYGLKFEHKMFSLQISTEKQDYFFLFTMIPGAREEYVTDIDKVKEIHFWKFLLAIHNAKFDMTRIRHADNRTGRVWCTMAQERLIKNNLWTKGSYSLAGCAKRHGIEEKDDGVELWFVDNGVPRDKRDYTQVPYNIMYDYGIQDARTVRLLALKQIEFFSTNDKLKELANTESALTSVLHSSEYTGVRLDREYTFKARTMELDLNNSLREEFKLLTGKEFIDSTVELPKILAELKIPFRRNMYTNNAVLDKDALKAMNHPVADCILKIRKSDTLLNMYDNFINFCDEDGFIHFDAKQSGTDTGRMSYATPALQTIPKEDGDTFSPRKCLIPREGFDFFMMDYDQQEYRVMLDYAGEKNLIHAVKSGLDVHTATAQMVGVDRKFAKTLNFAILYGSGIQNIADMLGLEYSQAKKMRQDYFNKLPMVHDFISKVKMVGEQRGYIFSWSGRKFYCDDKKFAYKLPNHLIQGSCADIVKKAMVDINNLFIDLSKHGSRIVIQVHDELLFEIHKDEHFLVPMIKDIMENVYPAKNDVKLTVGCEMSSKSWSQKDKENYEIPTKEI